MRTEWHQLQRVLLKAAWFIHCHLLQMSDELYSATGQSNYVRINLVCDTPGYFPLDHDLLSVIWISACDLHFAWKEKKTKYARERIFINVYIFSLSDLSVMAEYRSHLSGFFCIQKTSLESMIRWTIACSLQRTELFMGFIIILFPRLLK